MKKKSTTTVSTTATAAAALRRLLLLSATATTTTIPTLLSMPSRVESFSTRPLRIFGVDPSPLPSRVVPIVGSDGSGSTAAAAASGTASTTTALGCQLLGMNCASPSELSLSWPSFCERGGATDVHRDGWGLAYYDDSGQGIRQFHDVEAASTSPLAQFLGRQRIRTSNMMAHIRYATSGAVDLANVHPFSREMWGLNWSFCHNGQVPLLEDHPSYWLGRRDRDEGHGAVNGDGGLVNGDDEAPEKKGERFYYPIGSTDSEAFFCALLNALRAQYRDNMPSLPVLYESIQQLCREAVDYDPDGTILNFLLTCGPHTLWVYSWPGQRPGSDVWNGLHYTVRHNSTNLSDDDYSFDVSMPNSSVSVGGGDCNNDSSGGSSRSGGDASAYVNGDTTTLVVNGYDDDRRGSKECAGDGASVSSGCCESCCIVATKPLTTDEEWIELGRGELILFDDGLPHVSPTELFRVELQGHGLNNDGRAEIQPPRLEEDMRRYEFQPEFFAAGGI